MGKTKDTEKRKPEVEEKMDGLEIISIGSLYKGPWDKKYWSSSRGKDRYPYPVGYKACRAHNGTTYKMEIHEGVNGPKFVISSADVCSCSGKTPEIVWEEFQKRSSPRMKNYFGKRLSPKMDGLELFGFKNPLIQRLLRELVTDINGTAEQSLVASNLCDGISRIEIDDCRPNSGTSPDLLFPGKAQFIGKRSRGCEIKSTKSHDGTLLKRPRSLELTHRSRTSKRKNERILSQGVSVAHYGSEEIEMANPNGELASLNLMSSEKESTNHLSSKSSFPLNEVSNDTIGGDVPPTRTSELVDSWNCRSTGIAEKLCTEEDPLCRPQDAEVKVPNLSLAREDVKSFASARKKSKECSEIGLFAADTLDLVQEDTYDSDLSSLGKNAYNEEAYEIAPGGLLSEARQEENFLTSNLNPSPEKIGFDSGGQDVAKSMMTLLLPQAIPLLKNSSSNKKFNIGYSGMFPSGVTSMDVDNKIGNLLDVPASYVVATENACVEREEKTHMPNTDLSSINDEHARSVIPDSYDQYEDCKTTQPILSSDTADASRAGLKKEICSPISQEHIPNDVLAKTSSMYNADTYLTKKSYHDPELDIKDWPQDGGVCIPVSMTDCLSPMKRVISESSNDACADMEENPVQVGLVSLQKGPKTEHGFTGDSSNELTAAAEEKGEFVVKTGNTETVVMPPAQVPNFVYTRRKIKYSTPRTGKRLLPEITECEKIGEYKSNETYMTEGNLPPSEISQMKTSDDKQSETDSLDIKARDEVHFGDFCRADSSTSSQIKLNSTKSEDKSNTSASKDKLYAHPDLADSHVETSQSNRDEQGKQSSLVELNNQEPFQNQDLNFCKNNCSSTQEAQFIPDLKPLRNQDLNNDLDSIVKLVGCYIHPKPVSFLLLSTRENEIYLCVICGLHVDQERTLFTYKIAIKEPRVGCPSLLSYTPILLPDCNFIVEESSGLQLTPDGQYNVLLGCIKTPYCREGKICCSCSTCTAHSSENAVKIVQVGQGYVSVVATLETVENMHCILVCEPNQLVSVGESGRLQVWIMNSTWREKIEDFTIPCYDSISPGIVELKRVPKSANLVAGRDCFGEFSLWDISKRNCVSSFSASTNPINQFFPISLFNWQTDDPGFSHASLEEQAGKLLEATDLWFSEYKDSDSFLPSKKGDLAMWLLVSTASDLKSHYEHVSSKCKTETGSWRLALLVKNTVIFGSPLDPRTASIGVSGGHGIIGTFDGLVYMWELSRGSRLGTLHNFQDGAVTCIATDDSRGAALAVAGGGGQLLVYLHHKELGTN